ncbi:hypothetical protein F4780DRAFT_417592 [Xylariomycetidae sp. FL0641]|nr:hypothetical protein F4780DRAFT_417592 [Xylariomycetidae sp. FL0641]
MSIQICKADDTCCDSSLSPAGCLLSAACLPRLHLLVSRSVSVSRHLSPGSDIPTYIYREADLFSPLALTPIVSLLIFANSTKHQAHRLTDLPDPSVASCLPRQCILSATRLRIPCIPCHHDAVQDCSPRRVPCHHWHAREDGTHHESCMDLAFPTMYSLLGPTA